jgi:hypothetical protein
VRPFRRTKGLDAKAVSASEAEGSVDVSVRVDSDAVPLAEERDSAREKARVLCLLLE